MPTPGSPLAVVQSAKRHASAVQRAIIEAEQPVGGDVTLEIIELQPLGERLAEKAAPGRGKARGREWQRGVQMKAAVSRMALGVSPRVRGLLLLNLVSDGSRHCGTRGQRRGASGHPPPTPTADPCRRPPPPPTPSPSRCAGHARVRQHLCGAEDGPEERGPLCVLQPPLPARGGLLLPVLAAGAARQAARARRPRDRDVGGRRCARGGTLKLLPCCSCCCWRQQHSAARPLGLPPLQGRP